MSMNPNKIFWLGVLGVTTGLTIYYVRRSAVNKKLEKKIHSSIDGRVYATGLVSDFGDVWAGDPYITKVKDKVHGAGKEFIKLSREWVTKYRQQLQNAIEGQGTDEEAVYSVLNALQDKVQVAQVSQSYMIHGGKDLGQALDDDLDEDENKKAFQIIMNKPNFRIAKKSS